jgi:2-keto-3-deoxy-L-fuconate dehydrogenase
MDISGRHAIVTGAASGIGLAIVRRFAAAGATVTAVDLWNGADSRHLLPGGVDIRICDVSDERSVEMTCHEVEQTFGRIDILVTAAGISVGLTAEETSLDLWKKVINTNATGTFLFIKKCLPNMRRRGRGSIITIASQRAVAGGTASTAYLASKGAVLSLTRNIALDYATQGIRANAILPGAIETPLLESSFSRTNDPDAARSRSIARHPMARLGRPDEVAAAALFLASDEASFITGAFLPVDGGWLAG